MILVVSITYTPNVLSLLRMSLRPSFKSVILMPSPHLLIQDFNLVPEFCGGCAVIANCEINVIVQCGSVPIYLAETESTIQIVCPVLRGII